MVQVSIDVNLSPNNFPYQWTEGHALTTGLGEWGG